MRVFLLLFFCSFCLNTEAQSRYQFGVLPVVNVNMKHKNDWRFNLKVESRQLLKEGVFKQATDFNHQHILNDFSFVVAKKVGFNHSLAGGYLLRMRDEALIHRLLQQYTISEKYAGFRMAYRFSTDQTFVENKPTTYRARFRVATEFPLNGQSVDRKEMYLKVNQESLNVFQEGTYDLELRLVPLIGYVFTDNNKVEVGVDYRLDSFLSANTRQRFWIKLNWFLTIQNREQRSETRD